VWVFVLALVGLPVLVVHALPHGTAAVVGASVFGGTLALLYISSTLYHALTASRAKAVFRVLDHSAIYLLIAGTYTPFTLGVLRGPWGWSLFGVIWALAAAGVVLKSTIGMRYPRLSTAVYLLMGWLVVVAAKPLWTHMAPWGLFWLATGGVAYTAGVVLYAAPRLRLRALPVAPRGDDGHGLSLRGGTALLGLSAGPPAASRGAPRAVVPG